MDNDQKGITSIIVILGLAVALVILGGGYYLGTLAKPLIKQSNFQPSESPTATQTSEPSSKPTSIPTSAPVTQAPTFQPVPQSTLPSDIPLFAGAKIAYTTRMKSCGYQESNKFCEVNSFIYQIPKPGLSVNEVLDWYVSNPNPSWVYGTPTFTQANSGKVVKGDTYFIIRIAGLNGTENGVQLTFEGPYEQK